VVTAAAQETFSREDESVARVDNAPIDPALTGFVPIPNTPARFKIDGYAKLDTIFDTHPAGNPDVFNVGTIPIGLSRPELVANVNIHIRQTRLQLDLHSPTNLQAEFRAFVEVDFFGSGGPVDPRLRHFYGQVKNLLIGQTFTAFTDPDAFPKPARPGRTCRHHPAAATTDSLHPPARQGPKRGAQHRTPAGAGTTHHQHGTFVYASAGCRRRYRLDRAAGHLQVGSLYRVLGYRIETANRKDFGYALHTAGGITVFGKDQIVAYVMGGRGAARYVDSIAGLNSDIDLNDQGTDIEPLRVFGSYVGYTHRWPRRLRSTFVYGYASIENTAAQSATAYRDGQYVSGNLLFNPFGSLNVGVEYLYGSPQQADGGEGATSRVQVAAKYDLFRKRPLDQK